MNLTVNDIELRRLVRDVLDLGIQAGAEHVLSELGLLSVWIRKAEAIRILGSEATYNKAVEKGMLHERKIGKGKNSPLVVLRKEVNYINQICLSTDF